MEESRRQFLKGFLKGITAIAAASVIQPATAQNKQDDLDTFMQFSMLLTEEENLSPAFGELCWRYTKQHAKPEHIEAMHRFVQAHDAKAREMILSTNSDLKSIAYHTLLVWYKGDISTLNPSKDDIKLAYFNALKWRAIGVPARGLCNPDWSKTCTTL